MFLKILTFCKGWITVGQPEQHQTKETSSINVSHGFCHEQCLERNWDMYASVSDVEARIFRQIHPFIVCKLMLLNLSKEFSRVSCFISDKTVLTEHSFYSTPAKPLVCYCQSKYSTDCEGHRNCRCFLDILHKIRPSYSGAPIHVSFWYYNYILIPHQILFWSFNQCILNGNKQRTSDVTRNMWTVAIFRCR